MKHHDYSVTCLPFHYSEPAHTMFPFVTCIDVCSNSSLSVTMVQPLQKMSIHLYIFRCSKTLSAYYAVDKLRPSLTIWKLIIACCTTLMFMASWNVSSQQSSGTGFQHQMFPLLGSRTVPVPQLQQPLTHSALKNFTVLAPLHMLKSSLFCSYSKTVFTFTGYILL
jgi:hypothetical protein